MAMAALATGNASEIVSGFKFDGGGYVSVSGVNDYVVKMEPDGRMLTAEGKTFWLKEQDGLYFVEDGDAIQRDNSDS